MSSGKIRFLVVIGAFCILGISITQFYWMQKAFDQKAEEFHRDVNRSLNEVANELVVFSKSTVPSNSPIKQVSSNYYVVMVNGPIDSYVLEELLTNKLTKYGLKLDFEYGVYDCDTECLVYGDYVSFNQLSGASNGYSELPLWNESSYYFSVFFPNQSAHLVGSMGIWIFSSIVLIVVILFFSYALFVIFKQKKLSEVQRDFINNITHEFKTPISTIEIASSVIANETDSDSSPRLKKYADIISTENNRLKEHVERVLQVGQMQDAAIDLSKETVNMHQLLSDAVAQLKSTGRDISVKLNAVGHEILADSFHMSNIIYNLLDNAIKYSSTESPIEVRTDNNSEDDFVMTFQDHGIGIPETEQKRIFSKFYRVSTGNVHDVKGFGIGLYYVHSLCTAHGGRIELESVEGKGSLFRITIPQK